MKAGKLGIRFTTISAVMAEQIESMSGGEKFCTSAPPHVDTPPHWFEYDGPCSWAPTEWQLMVDAMQRDFAPHTALGPTGFWNEIVAGWPATAADMARVARALFYISTPAMDAKTIAALKAAARRNAAMYGGRPVLLLDYAKLLAGGPLFTCAEEADTDKGLGDTDEVDRMDAAQVQALTSPAALAKFVGTARTRTSRSATAPLDAMAPPWHAAVARA